MSEPIFKRMQRVVSAGLESATGAAERLNSSGMMRRALSEVEQAIDKLQKRQDRAKARAVQAGFQEAAIRDQANALTRDARYALDKGPTIWRERRWRDSLTWRRSARGWRRRRSRLATR